MKLGTYRRPDQNHSGTLFGVYAEEYIDSPNAKGQPLADTTKEKYRSYLRLHLVGFLERSLDSITTAEVRQWHAELNRAHPTTSARVYSFLSAVLSRAVEDELLVRNPCRVRGARQASSGIQKHFPTDEEIRLMTEHMNARFKMLVTFAALSGLRVGELRALRVKHLRRIANEAEPYYTVDVRHSVSNVRGELVTGSPKSAKGVRSNKLPTGLTAHLDSYLASLPQDEDAYVFPSEDGSKPFDPGVLSNNWKRAKARAGINVKNFTPHCLRHYAATHYLRTVSNNMVDLKAFLGDASDAAVWRYLHFVESSTGNKAVGVDIRNLIPAGGINLLSRKP